jgi:hypothetical protein
MAETGDGSGSCGRRTSTRMPFMITPVSAMHFTVSYKKNRRCSKNVMVSAAVLA